MAKKTKSKKAKKTVKKTAKKSKVKAAAKKGKLKSKKAAKKIGKITKAIKGKVKKLAKKIKKPAAKAKKVAAKKAVAPKKLSTLAKLEKQGNDFIKGAQSAVSKAGETISEGYSDVKKDIASTTDKVMNTIKENAPAITTAAAIGVGIVATKLATSKSEEEEN